MKKRIFLAFGLIAAVIGSISAQEWQAIDLQSSITHTQPMTGIVFWPDQAADKHSTLGSSISLEFQYCLPCKVVTGKQNGQIQYNWQWLETILNDIASRGHQAVLRFRYEYPNGEKINGVKGATAVPDYIKTLSDYHETYSANPGGDGPTYYADWSNSELQWFTRQFYTDFEAQYGNDPRIAFVEVGFGHWSEYHIYGTTLQLGQNFPSKQYQTEFFQHLDTTMTLPWLVSVDAGDSHYTAMQTDAGMRGCTFGLFDDSFMHSEHELSQGDGWNEQCWQWCDPQKTRWHTGVNGGEISYYSSSDQKNFLNPAGMYGVTWEQMAAKYHMTFIIGNDAPSGKYATATRMTEAALAAGYRFRVTAAESDGTSTRLTVTNKGVAPIYYDAYFAIGTVRSAESLKGLLPGQSRQVTIAATGQPAIVCDHLVAGQEIQYEAALQATDNRQLITDNKQQITGKEMKNGHLYIRRGSHVYDAQGRKW